MSLVETFFFGVMTLGIIIIVIAIIYKILYCLLLSLHCILKPCCCWNTPNHYDLFDDFDYFFNNIYYSVIFSQIKLSRYKCRKKKITKIKPIYDDVHIVFINPNNKFQIGTVSTFVNSV